MLDRIQTIETLAQSFGYALVGISLMSVTAWIPLVDTLAERSAVEADINL